MLTLKKINIDVETRIQGFHGNLTTIPRYINTNISCHGNNFIKLSITMVTGKSYPSITWSTFFLLTVYIGDWVSDNHNMNSILV